MIELLWALDQIRCVRDDVYLLVIGDGDARPLYERYARLYEIADRVRFLGWRSDAAALIAQLGRVLLGQQRSLSSLAVLEAMALGVPVVAGDTPAHRHWSCTARPGFLWTCGNGRRWRGGACACLEDEGLAGRMRESARRRAVEKFRDRTTDSADETASMQVAMT